MKAMHVDLELVHKYNVPGPRYTSYPPATVFTDGIKAGDVIEAVRAGKETDRPLSLYFHIPFCQTLCWYCGCTTVITTQQSQSRRYIDYLEREMELMRESIHPGREAVQLHFGGGTPTYLVPDEIRYLGGLIQKNFKFSADIEAGVEIDPRRLTLDHVKALREAGFNRASIGIQDHDPEVQKAVHRIQPREENRKVVDWIRETGFSSLNVDLIYGLPKQTPSSFERTLDEVLEFNPDRFAVFSYAHVPWIKPSQKIFKQEELPGAETKLRLLKLTIEKLTSSGYVYIGMDHFAREGDELAVALKQKTLQRNFQGYSTRGGTDIFSFGMSSISQADGVYWQNEKELPPYYAALDQGELPIAKGYIMTEEDRIRRHTIMRLMCDLGLDYALLSEQLGISFREHFAPELDSLGDLEADGLVILGPDSLTVTDRGRLFIRNIAMRFDAYLPAAREGRFSKTI